MKYFRHQEKLSILFSYENVHSFTSIMASIKSDLILLCSIHNMKSKPVNLNMINFTPENRNMTNLRPVKLTRFIENQIILPLLIKNQIIR